MQEYLTTEGVNLQRGCFLFIFNDLEGFNSFNLWTETLKAENKKSEVLIGCESTGHYWLCMIDI